ncbi:hypothetical protein Z517_09345 [Fonsecaea pedrosoi CBS 271.37]|uniref:Uncharacterized protein n=1 Tax=Fonsecaea pedrosoi CBS 271.37 TaxID=1442368 RepID=A0A0D2DGU3_9EURO|nr:uncharacterized protein Z517_09345 [Fonsecaea pedrosoi CBS 271.37]KIW76901.1 hypothetical protein Z517_09345 [Fonsecaea pedrosoi CBS 271.37]
MSLSDLPLTVPLVLSDSDRIPRSIPRDRTYVTTDAYIRDLLVYHDMKLRYQPNAAISGNVEATHTDQNSPLPPGFLTTVTNENLNKHTHWFRASLNYPRVTDNLFMDHLQPRLAPSQVEGNECTQFQEILASYWTMEMSLFIDQKFLDRKAYLKDLRAQDEDQGR